MNLEKFDKDTMKKKLDGYFKSLPVIREAKKNVAELEKDFKKELEEAWDVRIWHLSFIDGGNIYISIHLESKTGEIKYKFLKQLGELFDTDEIRIRQMNTRTTHGFDIEITSKKGD